LRLKDHLREAIPIAQIDEDEEILIAARIHPAVYDNGFADVAFAQPAASMSSPHEGHIAIPSAKMLSRDAQRSAPLRVAAKHQDTLLFVQVHALVGSFHMGLMVWIFLRMWSLSRESLAACSLALSLASFFLR